MNASISIQVAYSLRVVLLIHRFEDLRLSPLCLYELANAGTHLIKTNTICFPLTNLNSKYSLDIVRRHGPKVP